MTASTTPRQPKSRIARHLRFGQRPPDSVAIGMLDRGQVILRYPIGKEAPITLRSSTRLLDMDLRLWLDLELGELVAAGRIRIRRLLRRKWRTIFESEGKAIVHMDPSVGVIDGRSEAYAPDLRAAAKELKFPEEFARVRLCAPVPLRFYVDDKLRFVSNAGQIVKRKVFPAPYGSFIFNTVACVGELDDQGRGAYADPQSPWFNIFLGYYQIDVEVSKWGRPFGYESDGGIDSEVHHEDIIRLGKADWNWFSNWMYGVPAEYLEDDIDAIDPDTTVEVSPQLGKIGNSLWHSVAMDNVKVKSCFESDAPGAPKLVNNSPLTFVWRDAFGRPYPRKGKNYRASCRSPCGPTCTSPTHARALLPDAHVRRDRTRQGS